MKISNDGTGSKLLQILGKLEATQKSFVVTSPDGKRLEYGTLEGPEYGIFCRGHLIGDNIIELPED